MASFKALAPVGLVVTSYEGEEEQSLVPILTHIFWGKDIKEALSYAKSHTVTDYFFSSNFIGRMKWHDGELQLSYETRILGIRLLSVRIQDELLDKTTGSLEQYALRVNNLQREIGLDAIISEILSELDQK